MDYSSMETPTSICWGNYHLSAFAQPQPNLKQNYQLWNFKISFSQRCLKPSKPFTVEDTSTLLFQSGLVFLRLNEVTLPPSKNQLLLQPGKTSVHLQCHTVWWCPHFSCCIWYAHTDFHSPLWLNFNHSISTQNFSAVREKSEPYLYI